MRDRGLPRPCGIRAIDAGSARIVPPRETDGPEALAAASPGWKTAGVAAPETLEEIVRAELREPVADVVRRLVVELAREELARIAASVNGGPGPTAETVLLGPQSPQEPPGALGEGSGPSLAQAGDAAALYELRRGEVRPRLREGPGAMPNLPGRGRPRPLPRPAGPSPGRRRPGVQRGRGGGAGVSVEAIACRIDAEPDDVVRLLDDELALGRVRRTDAGGWTLVADAFAAGTVEALRRL
jgi:hypothetical protein